MRLIDAERLIGCINTVQEMALAMGGKLEAIEPVNEGFISLVNSQPTIDAEPVRHGKWWRYPLEQLGFPEHVYMMRQCSECKKVFDQKWNYCPNCGAKMEKRKEE